MFLENIQLLHFKNYTERKFDFSSGINAISGKNGVDAIHYLSVCKSYYTTSDQQNIRHGDDFFALHGFFHEDGIDGVTQVSCIQKKDFRKIFKINQKEYGRLSEHIGRFPSVMISPYDQDYIQGGSESRRRYFDGVVSQSDHAYMEQLIQYSKLLLQRNALLKQAYESGRLDSSTFEVWDERLVAFGAEIHAARLRFLADFMPVFTAYYRSSADTDETVDIQYESQLNEADMTSLLTGSLQRDYYAGHTTCGIHKDDYHLLLNGYPIRRYGSQGQQKTFLIALKLAQFDYLKERNGKSPLLLLDDVFDKLDYQRIRSLTALVSQPQFGQVFMTDTQQDRLEALCRDAAADFQSIKL